MPTIRAVTSEIAEVMLDRSDYPLESVLAIPGVRLQDTVGVGGERWLRIPRNAFDIPQVQQTLSSWRLFQPGWPQRALGATVLKRPLFKHQTQAVERMCDRGALLLGDAMGLGKTTSAATAAKLRLAAQPGRTALILGPGYLESVWRSELETLGFGALWACRGADPEHPKRGLHTCPQGQEWIFCHYDILRHWWRVLQHVRLAAVVFDEAHLLKSATSMRTKAAKAVVGHEAARFALTGTPVVNRLGEAHTLLSLVTGGQTWGSSVDFRRRYASAFHTGYGWVDGAPSNQEELQHRLGGIYLRRDASALEEALPERTRKKISVELDERTAQRAREILQGYTPKQILDAIRKSGTGDKTLEWLGKLRKATSTAKIPTTVALAKSIIEQGDSVVIFTWERKTAFRIDRELNGDGAVAITGEMNQEARTLLLNTWKASASPIPLTATYGALSTGVTLTKANHVILHDLDFVPATMLQAEARVHRIGQNRPTQSYWPVAEGTLDPFIFDLINRKAPATAVLGELDTADLSTFLGTTEDRDLEDILAWSMEHAR